jgi:hypothetical protein
MITCLCHEAERLRCRARQLLADLGRCQHPPLRQRLQRELEQLQARRQELQRIARMLRRSSVVMDRLALALFEEVTARPLLGA